MGGWKARPHPEQKEKTVSRAGSVAHLAFQNSKRLSEVFSENDHTTFMTGHDNNLFRFYIRVFEKTLHGKGQFGRSVLSRLRRCRSAVEERRPQRRVVAMNDRSGVWL